MSIDTKGVGSLVDLATVLPPLNQIPPRELSDMNAPGESHSNIVDGFLGERGDGNVNACALATVTVTVTESEPANPASQSALPARTATSLTLSSATAQPQRRVDEPPRVTYYPITYYEVAYATFTLIVDSTTLIPLADGSTKTTFAPFRTTITEPYTQTLTKPTEAPAQAASLFARNEKRQDEAPHDDGPVVVVTDVIITEVFVTETITADVPPSPDVVTQLLTATVYPVPESPDPVTQVVTATVYPLPAPLLTEWQPPVPREEQHRAAVAAAGEAIGDTENTKPRATFGVLRHTPQFLSVWTTCTITISSTIATSTVATSTPVPVYTPLTSTFSTSTISTTPSYAPPASTLTTSASALTSLSIYSSSLTTSTNASASAPSSSAATTTPPSATSTPSTSNAGTVGGGGRGGAALAATMAVLWGLLATVG
ncbi:hypothetical protein BKA80DRAFT_254518 [Phyllosticta citrichinensis]